MTSAKNKAVVTINRNVGMLKYIFRSTNIQILIIDRVKHEKEARIMPKFLS